MTNINCFYVCNGAQLYSLVDLLGELKTIDDGAFHHHVNEERNDFSNWIKDELKDKTLSNQVGKTTDKEKIIKAIEKRLNSSVNKKKETISKIKRGHKNE